MPVIKHLNTREGFATDTIEILHDGFLLRVEKSGPDNWSPPGTPWLASIHAAIDHYEDPSKYAWALADWGATRSEAIVHAYLYALSQTMRVPIVWLYEIDLAITKEYGHESL